MKLLATIFREILGLFVDDQGLALVVLGVLAVALLLGFGLHATDIAGAALVLGCLAGLAYSVLKGRPHG
jgi:hypothetical protein